MKESYAVVTRLKSGESIPSSAETDFVRNSAGDMFTPTGQKVVHEGNINTVLASAGGAQFDDWAANTEVKLHQIVAAPAIVGTVKTGDLLRSNSARTTGTTFNTTELANWTEVSEDPVQSVAGKTGVVTLAKADVGLGNADNTSDANKPVSTAQQTALNLKLDKTAGTGVFAGTLPSRSNAPATITTTNGYGSGAGPWVVNISSSLVGVVVGDRWVNNGEFVNITAIDRVAGTVTVSGPTFYHSPGVETLQAIGTGVQDPVYQVLAKKDVGLTNADNTADTAKPVSTAQQTALDLKADNTDLTDGSISGYFDSMRTDGVINLASGADLNTLTDNGVFNVSAPLNAPVTGGWWYVEHYRHRNTTIIDGNYAFQRAVRLDSVANTWYHRTRVNATWGSWAEVADIADLATYAPLASPALTGTPTAPTATAGTNTTQLATTAFINTALTGGGVSAQFDELRYDRVRPLTGTDLNVLTTSGFYDGNNLTNAPGGSTDWFYIEHLQHSNVGDPNWRMQKAYGLGSPNSGFSAAGTMYIRTMVGGVWQAWRTVTTT